VSHLKELPGELPAHRRPVLNFLWSFAHNLNRCIILGKLKNLIDRGDQIRQGTAHVRTCADLIRAQTVCDPATIILRIVDKDCVHKILDLSHVASVIPTAIHVFPMIVHLSSQ